MKKLIATLQIIALIAAVSGCASTHVVSTKTGKGYAPISGWGSSIDPVEEKGRGGYYNSVFYY